MHSHRADTPGIIRIVAVFAAAAMLAAWSVPAGACTSILVTRGASADGSVIITYSCDDAGNYCTLGITPAADHKPGEMIEVGPPPGDKARAARFRKSRIPTGYFAG